VVVLGVGTGGEYVCIYIYMVCVTSPTHAHTRTRTRTLQYTHTHTHSHPYMHINTHSSFLCLPFSFLPPLLHTSTPHTPHTEYGSLPTTASSMASSSLTLPDPNLACRRITMCECGGWMEYKNVSWQMLLVLVYLPPTSTSIPTPTPPTTSVDSDPKLACRRIHMCECGGWI
jgi:hypothetical protein